MYQSFNFLGRKPSKAQILKKASALANQGCTEIEIFWGENFITLIKRESPNWLGLCWIKDVSGDEIAASMNKRAI